MQISTDLLHNLQNYLDVSSAELKLTAGNMANASTPGYTVESVTWQESAPLEDGSSLIGSGVVDRGAVSQRDRVLNQSVDQQTQAHSATAARLTALTNLESTFSAATSTSSTSSVATDISSGLSDFFGSLQQLEAAPSNASLREAVLSTASNLADTFQTAASNLQQQQAGLDGEVSLTLTQVNSLSSAIAGLNKQIASASPNKDAGTLEDQRQYDLASLSKLIGIQQVTTENNGLTVTTSSGSVLVIGNQSLALVAGSSGGVTHLYSAGADITSALRTGDGQIGGLLEARDTDIPSTLSSLDGLANAVGTAVNSANQAGTDSNGHVGGAIFALPVGIAGSAAAITVIITDPSLIAAAAAGAGSGDGSNAAAMAALAGKPIVNGKDPSDAFAAFVSSIGDTVASVTASSTRTTGCSHPVAGSAEHLVDGEP